MHWPTDSLRSRLVLSGLLGMGIAAIAVAWVLGAAFERSLIGSFDRRLSDDLLTLAGLLAADGDARVRLRGNPVDSRYSRVFSGHYWMVRQGDNVYRSRSLWDADLDAQTPAAGHSLAFRDIRGPIDQQLRSATQALRIAGVTDPVEVVVASEVSDTRADIRDFRLMAGLAGAFVAAGLLVAIATQAAYGLRPLQRMASALETLRRGESKRLEIGRVPVEVRPLAEELNALLAHHERMLERASLSAEDLAHALKSPLAVLQLAARRPDASLPALVRTQASRMQASIARHLDSAATPGLTHHRTAVTTVLRSLVAMLSQAHSARDLRFQVSMDEMACFRGAQADLEDMLGNLVENACKWARSSIEIHAGIEAEQLVVTIRDDGPGIAAEQLQRVVERGVRLDEHAPGSGLGLAIVSRLADSYGGALNLQAGEAGGLLATLRLPGNLQTHQTAYGCKPHAGLAGAKAGAKAGPE